MAAKFIKDSKKIKLFREIVKLFEDDRDHLLASVIPGAYLQSYIDPDPDPSLGLVLAGKTSGAKYWVPSTGYPENIPQSLTLKTGGIGIILYLLLSLVRR